MGLRMMADLTAADLARLDHLRRRADEGEYEAAALQAIANHFSVPALVATVRELARAIVAAMEGTAWATCPFCDLTSREGHYPSCAYERARALLGGATPMGDERQPVYVDQLPDEPVVYLPVHRPRTVGERLAEVEARYDDQYGGRGVMPYRAFTDMGWLIVTLRRLLEERDDE